MKSYISRKFPLATRNTVRSFSLRCAGVSIWSGEPLVPPGTRGCPLELRLEADIVGAADDVVSRRVGGERLAADERRSLVADIRETRRQFEMIDDGLLRIVIEVVIG